MTQPPSVELPAPVTRVTAAVPSAKGWTMFEENGQCVGSRYPRDLKSRSKRGLVGIPIPPVFG